MSLVFLRTLTDMGPRTVVFSASDRDGHLICQSAEADEALVLPDRGPYNTVRRLLELRKEAKLFSLGDARHGLRGAVSAKV